MKTRKLLTFLLAIIALNGMAQVQSTTALLGSWTGKLDLGVAKLTLVFHLKQADGFVYVTMEWTAPTRV